MTELETIKDTEADIDVTITQKVDGAVRDPRDHHVVLSGDGWRMHGALTMKLFLVPYEDWQKLWKACTLINEMEDGDTSIAHIRCVDWEKIVGEPGFPYPDDDAGLFMEGEVIPHSRPAQRYTIVFLDCSVNTDDMVVLMLA